MQSDCDEVNVNVGERAYGIHDIVHDAIGEREEEDVDETIDAPTFKRRRFEHQSVPFKPSAGTMSPSSSNWTWPKGDLELKK